jgi:hypothetical protein
VSQIVFRDKKRVSAQIGWLSHQIARSACFAYSLY